MRSVCLAALALALVPAGARAAVVEGDATGDDRFPGSVSVDDPRGVDNRLELTVRGTRVTVRERGRDPLTARGT